MVRELDMSLPADSWLWIVGVYYLINVLSVFMNAGVGLSIYRLRLMIRWLT